MANQIDNKLHLIIVFLQRTCEKRKEERKKAFKDKDRDDECFSGRRYREHYVGGRELDRRSRRHRSKSRERRDRGGQDKERKDRDRERYAPFS